MGESFADDFMKTFNELELPGEIYRRFDILECLSENDYGQTYKLFEKDSGKRYVLKCYRKAGDVGATREAELLQGLFHNGLPTYEPEIETVDMLLILREYIDGIPLDKYIAENSPDETRTLAIIMELCDVLSYLHSQPAPIIHRDIKPSNIIVDLSSNSVKLIDFGISRRYSEDSDFDTAYYGTKRFSPPEQYGFSQTDCRADIYALGVVLRLMLTGLVDGQVKNRGFHRIIAKCTAFSPKDRYQSCESLKRALKRALTRILRPVLYFAPRAIAATLVLCAIIAAWFFIGNLLQNADNPPPDPFGSAPHTEDPAILPSPPPQPPQHSDEPSPPHSPTVDEPYTFIEPLFEEAVRLMLDIPDGQPVTESDLDNITRLYITGNTPMLNDDEYSAIVFSGDFEYGTINRLDDLCAMKNLRGIRLSGQPITDLSPLADCPLINNIDIHESSITDISPLAAMPRLRFLALQGNNI